MKALKIKADSIIKSFLAGVISLLGFTSCEDPAEPDGGGTICMYGTPTAEYEIKGTVTDEAGQAVERAMVIMRYINEHNNKVFTGDTVLTDSKGSYLLAKRGWPYQKIRMVCKPEQETLEADSINMTVSFKDGKDDWDHGIARETVDFTLKFKK